MIGEVSRIDCTDMCSTPEVAQSHAVCKLRPTCNSSHVCGAVANVATALAGIRPRMVAWPDWRVIRLSRRLIFETARSRRDFRKEPPVSRRFGCCVCSGNGIAAWTFRSENRRSHDLQAAQTRLSKPAQAVRFSGFERHSKLILEDLVGHIIDAVKMVLVRFL